MTTWSARSASSGGLVASAPSTSGTRNNGSVRKMSVTPLSIITIDSPHMNGVDQRPASSPYPVVVIVSTTTTIDSRKPTWTPSKTAIAHW
jgi:hypothetical protein